MLHKRRLENFRSPSEFWHFIKPCTHSHKNIEGITLNEWQVYFSALYNLENDLEKNSKAIIKAKNMK